MIEPNSSSSIPIDLIDCKMNLNLGGPPEAVSQASLYDISSTFKNPPKGLDIGQGYAAIVAKSLDKYKLLILEPMVQIQNCLPFPIKVMLLGEGKQSTMFNKEIKEHELVSAFVFNHDHKIAIMCNTQGYVSNNYEIYPSRDPNQQFYFEHRKGKVPLNLHIVSSPKNQSMKVWIAAKILIVQEIQENLAYLSVRENNKFLSPFKFNAENGDPIVLFSDMSELRILNEDLSQFSDGIPMSQLGVLPIDLKKTEKELLNLGVHVRSIICGRQFIFLFLNLLF